MKLVLIACKVLYREFCYYAAISRNVVELRFLEQGLHMDPDKLRESVQAEIDAVDGEYDAILVGYGLCSKGTEGLRSIKHKIVIPRAHDCITFFLGSKERYMDYFENQPGTYWYTPGWIETAGAADKHRFDGVYQGFVDKYGEDNARYLFEVMHGWVEHYDQAAYVDLGFGDNAPYKEHTKAVAAERGWEYVEVEGDSRLVVDLLEGNWDSDRFLVVEPGEAVRAAHDECILGVSR